MAWKTPKTDWDNFAGLSTIDMNRIEENTLEVSNMQDTIIDRTTILDTHFTKYSVNFPLSIAPTDWSYAPAIGVAPYLYWGSIYVSGITAANIISVSFDIDSMLLAQRVRVLPGCFATTNALNFYSQFVPSNTLNGTYVIIS